ncbi:hypothetical protein SYNTR_1479 [Candidatus Syntrophocurvum alkaliphilum]|uniref:Uncharacterized protein n=1 Tax=Candidatus Syntrophocurvum alkaliphilum TaxID=2293317 RepID=A0A6I6DGT8_9FIRM|nr:hypothetical protein SYNTR_1479 [Candidatus Syntrophocurvum alkaliphilum]
MLGLESLLILCAYILSITSCGLCVIYGIKNWNENN